MGRSRRRCVPAVLLPTAALALAWSSGRLALGAAAVLGPPRGPPARWAVASLRARGLRAGPELQRASAARAAEAKEGKPAEPEESPEEDGEDEDSESPPEDEEGLGRLKANAVAAWLVNITLVVWIVYLYQRVPTEESSEDIISVLSQELVDESTALNSDKKLKEDLRAEAEGLADIAKRIEDAKAIRDSQQPVLAQLQSLLANREAELLRQKETTERDLRQVAERTEVQRQRPVEDSIIGPLTSSASGVLAGIDVTIAAQFISLALLFSFAGNRLRQDGNGAPGAPGAPGATAAMSAAGASSTSATSGESEKEAKEQSLRSQNVLRFYGRWDEDREWVLLQSVALKGAGNTVIGSVRSARSWMGSWSDRIITSLVARSARGMVRRRGWKRIVEQTMNEVGRTFTLGYLLETAADKASPRIEVDSEEKVVLEVPRNIVLDAES